MASPQSIVTKQQSAVDEAAEFGNASALAKAELALAEAQEFAGGVTLPSYVPPVGKFAEFTLNTPSNAAPANYYNLYSFLSHWTGGALVRDYSAHGGVAYCGGGEHTAWQDSGGVLVLNLETRLYEMKCFPAQGTKTSAIWTGPPRGSSGATVNGNVAQLPMTAGLQNVPVTTPTNKSLLHLSQATNPSRYFGILVVDNVAKTLTLDVAPQGVSNSAWAVLYYQGVPTDDFGGMDAEAYPNKKHTYNGLQEMPAAWGGGPRGSLVRVSHTGGGTDDVLPSPPNTTPNGQMGKAATWKYDLSQDVGGVSRLTGDQHYIYASDGSPAFTNDAPCTGVDYLREGWWSRERMGSYPQNTRGMAFTSKTGQITNYPDPWFNTSYAQIHHFADEDLLFLLSGYNSTNFTFGGWVRRPPDVAPNDVWTKVAQAGLEAAVAPATIPVDHGQAIGYMGMRWCSHPNYQCFVGIPKWIRVDDTHVLILLLTPPPVGQRKTGVWQWSSEIVESHDGSIMKINVGSQTDHGILNGSFGKLVYCEPLRSLVWTRSVSQKGQLIRLARMD